MSSCISKYRFIRVRISFLASKIISGYLEAAGGRSWRPDRYRYDQTLIYAFMYVEMQVFQSQDFNSFIKNNIWPLGGHQRLILEAGQVQIQRSKSDMSSCMSKFRFFRVRISILTSKIISGTWRPLEADPGSWPGTDMEIKL